MLMKVEQQQRRRPQPILRQVVRARTGIPLKPRNWRGKRSKHCLGSSLAEHRRANPLQPFGWISGTPDNRTGKLLERCGAKAWFLADCNFIGKPLHRRTVAAETKRIERPADELVAQVSSNRRILPRPYNLGCAPQKSSPRKVPKQIGGNRSRSRTREHRLRRFCFRRAKQLRRTERWNRQLRRPRKLGNHVKDHLLVGGVVLVAMQEPIVFLAVHLHGPGFQHAVHQHHRIQKIWAGAIVAVPRRKQMNPLAAPAQELHPRHGLLGPERIEGRFFGAGIVHCSAGSGEKKVR